MELIPTLVTVHDGYVKRIKDKVYYVQLDSVALQWLIFIIGVNIKKTITEVKLEGE